MIAGADACRMGRSAGWAVVELQPDKPGEVRFEPDLAAYFARRDPDLLGIDIPIGLPALGERRQADGEAKRLLGAAASTVFYAPPRDVLAQPSYAEARNVEPLSAQAYALRAKIFEVEALAQQHGGRVIEVHPEVSFRVLSNRVLSKKRSWNGQHQRAASLRLAGIEIPADLTGKAGRIPPDDILDAAVVALTARHAANGTGRALPRGVHVENLSQRQLIWMPRDRYGPPEDERSRARPC